MMPLRERSSRGRRLAGADLGVHAQFAHLARDQMTVLPARIENGDLRLGNVLVMRSHADRVSFALAAGAAAISFLAVVEQRPGLGHATSMALRHLRIGFDHDPVGVVHAEGVSVHLALQLRLASSRGSGRTPPR